MSRRIDKRASKRGASQSKLKPQTEDERKRSLDRAYASWAEMAEQERSAWLRRPRLHTAIFVEAWEDDQLEKIMKKLKGVPQDPLVFERQKQKRKQEIDARIENLGWSEERLELFIQHVVAYRTEPSIENYLRIRRQFPEVEILVGRFGGLEALFKLQEDFESQGIDPHLIAAALDADEPGVDALCLRLLGLLAVRDSLPKSGPGHIEKRRGAISDTTVNYLIAMILEAYDWHDYISRVPGSLVVLIRHQLCKSVPDLDAELRLRMRQEDVALAVAQHLKPGEKLSINKLKTLAGLPRSTAARWLSDPRFQHWLENGRRWAAAGVFEKGKRAAIQRIMS
jgi:hypothetical protein